jgi:hypothetical protein
VILVRASILVAFPAIAATLALTACSDSVGPSSPRPVANDTTTPPPAPAYSAPYHVWLNDTPRDLAEGDSVLLDASVTDANGRLVSDASIEWESGNAAVAPASTRPFGAVRIVAASPGNAAIAAASLGARAFVSVTVLPRSSDPSPVVVDDFRVIAVRLVPSDDWYYTPTIALRDTSAAGGSAVIRTSFELPDAAPTPECATEREIPRAGRELFPEAQGAYGWTIGSSIGVLPLSGQAIVHLTVRTGAGTAVTMAVTGPIVVGTIPSTYSDDPPPAEALLCG